MFSPFYPPVLWQMVLSLGVFAAVWWLGRRRPGAWQVQIALLFVAVLPFVIAVGWLSWFSATMGRAGYTGPVAPERLVELQLASIFNAIFLTVTMVVLILIRGLLVMRKRAMAAGPLGK